MRALYPELEPWDSRMLDTGDGHRIYLEQSGGRTGLPVVFLHGGPGSGAKPDHRRYFHPQRYRIVIFDQRGSGRSRPFGELNRNDTETLAGDMERIRRGLDIESWVLCGGSWGATLALYYAQRFPERVRGMILRGAFLARRCDWEWIVGDCVRRVFPDGWREFIDAFPPEERDDPLQALHRRLFGADPAQRLTAAHAWERWAGQVVTWSLPLPEPAAEKSDTGGGEREEEDERTLVARARLEMHYACNRYFLEEDQLLRCIGKVPRVPVVLLHGRRDMTCPLAASWELHWRLPGSELTIVHGAGHLASEPEMADALLTATDRMAERLTRR